LKIVILASLPSSLVNFRGSLIAELVSKGNEVIVVAPGVNDDIAVSDWLKSYHIVAYDLPLSRSSFNPFSNICTLIAFYLLLRKVRPNLVLGYTIKPVIFGLLASAILGVPNRIALITGLGYAFIDDTSLKRSFIRLLVSRLYQISLRSSTRIIFQNVDDREDFQSMGILPARVPTAIVPGSGVDLAHYTAQPLPVGNFSFLLIARLLADKGIREYADAARQIRLKHPNVQFHLVGGLDRNPAGISELEVRFWQDTDVLIWHGHLYDVRPILLQTTAFVLPSYREGIPRTVLEAMATGRPVLTTNVPGCRETVIHGVNGYLFPPRDSKELADAMSELLRLSTDDLERMALASLRLARERFEVNLVNRQMILAMGL
jgi:glycosyltransferase involved in cell wall biosynthesis